MERQLGQMVRLVDDLLDVSRISHGKLELRREQVPLAAVIGNAVETSRPLIDRLGNELTVTLPQQPVLVDADPTRLAQVFANLLNNGAKYMDRGGHIRLTAERPGRPSHSPQYLVGLYGPFARSFYRTTRAQLGRVILYPAR